jgi:hypothetical protein
MSSRYNQTLNSQLNSLDSSIISANYQLWNSQSSSLLQLPTILITISSQSSSTANSRDCPQFCISCALDPHYIASGRPQQKTPFPNDSSVVIEMYTLPFHRNGSSSIVVCVFISEGTCLPSWCLAMNICSGSAIQDLQVSCHNI